MKRLFPLFFFIYINHANALCTAPPVAVNLPSSIVIQRDIPVGTVLASVTTSTIITCTRAGANATSENSWAVQLASTNPVYPASPLPNIRNTNVPGIGIRWRNLNSSTGATVDVGSGLLNSQTWQRGIALAGNTTFTDTFDLVKTGETPKSGSLTPIILDMQYSTPISTGVIRQPLFRYTLPLISNTTLSCSVMQSNVAVTLGRVYTSSFNGVSSTDSTGGKNFSIDLNCDSSANVNLTIDAGGSGAENATNGILNLDPVAGSQIATGVGVQLMYNNNPFPLGTMTFIDTPATSGLKAINMTARYIQTAATITPGIANASATFTLTYQ